jgi:hypothetical protein
MRHYFFTTLLLLLLFGCGPDNAGVKRDTSEINWSNKTYALEIKDTVHVNFIAKVLKLYDTSPDGTKHLLMSAFESFHVVVIDDSGQVLARHKPVGQGDGLVGEIIFGLGFLGNDQFIASSPKGFFVYDLLSGEFLKSYPLRTAVRGYEASNTYNIEPFSVNGQLHLAGGLKSSLENKDILNFRKEYFDEFKPITFLNTSDNTASLNFGIGPTSRFKRSDYHYGLLYTLFDFNEETQTFAVLNNPSDEISIWDTQSNLIKEIPLRLEEFKLPIRFKYGTGEVEDGSEVVNSQYKSLQTCKSNALISYRTGLPKDDFNAISSYAELPALFRQKMKYFGALVDLETGEVSKEFPLPDYSVGIASFNSMDNILLYTNPGVTETDSTTVFFRARLKETGE